MLVEFWSLLILNQLTLVNSFLEMIKTPLTTNLLNIVHIDVYSSLCVAVCGKSLYFIYFNRGFEWIYVYIYLIRKKYEMFENANKFQDEVKIIVTRKYEFMIGS